MTIDPADAAGSRAPSACRQQGTGPIAVLEKAWTRYSSHLEWTLEQVREGEHREPVLTIIQRHGRVLQNLHDEVA